MPACLECGEPFDRMHHNQNACSYACGHRARMRTRKAKERGAKVVETVYTDALRERDQDRCGICGGIVPLTVWPDPYSATIDHIVPVSKGGEHSYANTQLAHFRCNTEKGSSENPVENAAPTEKS